MGLCWLNWGAEMGRRSFLMILPGLLAADLAVAQSFTKCTSADGTVSYVQGACPGNVVGAEEIKPWDTDAKNYRPEDRGNGGLQDGQEDLDDIGDSDQFQPETSQPAREYAPCRSRPATDRDARRDLAACKALRDPHPQAGSECARLENEHFRRTASDNDFRRLIKLCRNDEDASDHSRCPKLNPFERERYVKDRLVVPGFNMSDVGRVLGYKPMIDIKVDDRIDHKTYVINGKAFTLIIEDGCVVDIK